MKDNEWYTPSRYIEAARKVMGSIDLDPASSAYANQTVRANQYYSKEQNGLSQPWIARNVWLNPPYGRTEGYGSNVKLFTEKLISEYKAGHINQAILLTSGKVDASWFQSLWSYALCFTNHHLRFVRNYDTKGKPGRYTEGHLHGSVFAYFGSHEQKFIDVFSEFGAVLPSGVIICKQKPINLELWSA